MAKLLSLNNYHYRRGGSDVVFLEHDIMFKNNGWDSAVFSMQHPNNSPSEWEHFFVDDIEYGHEYGFSEKINRAAKVIYSLEAKQKISNLLDEFPADIAHAHCIYHHISPSVLVELKRRSIPVVMTAHDLKLACPAYKMLNRSGICERCKGGNLLNLVIYKCIRDSLSLSTLIAIESAYHKLFGLYRNNIDRIVAPSRFYLEKHVEWGWPREKLAYIPNYIDVTKYSPQFTPGPYFLFFGRLALEKGVATLIRAAAQAGVVLRIAGTGPEGDVLRTLAQSVGARVEFLGYVGGNALWDQVRGARAIVLPSEWYENAPMSLLEAYACGKPVIGARIGGIPEMVLEGKTGDLFESGNVGDLASLLQQYQVRPDTELEAMGAASREYVASTFTATRYLSEMLSLYSSLGVHVPASASGMPR